MTNTPSQNEAPHPPHTMSEGRLSNGSGADAILEGYVVVWTKKFAPAGHLTPTWLFSSQKPLKCTFFSLQNEVEDISEPDNSTTILEVEETEKHALER